MAQSAQELAGVSAQSKGDLEKVAAYVGRMSEAQKTYLTVGALENGLMRMFWPLSLALKLTGWRHRHLQMTRAQLLFALLQRQTKARDAQLRDTLHWLVQGKEAEGKGVGGWNQQELDTFVELIRRAEVATAPKQAA